MRKVIVALFLSIFAASASAEFFTLEDWLNRMAAKDTGAVNFFIGVVDTGDTLIHCAPDGISVSAMISSVLRVTTQLPASAMQASAAKVITMILSKQHPCVHV
jgi:hypothetical protein